MHSFVVILYCLSDYNVTHISVKLCAAIAFHEKNLKSKHFRPELKLVSFIALKKDLSHVFVEFIVDQSYSISHC